MSTGFLFAQVGLGAVAGGAVIFLFSLFAALLTPPITHTTNCLRPN